MTSSTIDGWLKRADGFGSEPTNHFQASEALLFAISMASNFYGPSSPQVEIITTRSEDIAKKSGSTMQTYQLAFGSIRNIAAEIRGGLVKQIRLGIVGEVVADFVQLAKEALAENRIEVAAVLTAAAFEDTLRKLAQEKAGISERIKLDQVIVALKENKVLQGGEPGVVQGFLKFRNDSLHADWSHVTESQISSCLGLLDVLLVKHLS